MHGPKGPVIAPALSMTKSTCRQPAFLANSSANTTPNNSADCGLCTHCERNFGMSVLTFLIFSPFCLLCPVFVPVCGAYFT